MARIRVQTLIESARDARGFTLLELMTVCAILAILCVLAFPSVRRFNRAQVTKSGATEVAGVLEEARSRAVSEGTPHLVYVNDPATGDGSGGCGPIAVIVRDSDRSYSITDGDKQREYRLPDKDCTDVKLYGQDEASTPYADLLRLPTEDQAVLSTSVLGTTEVSDESEPGGALVEAVVNGSTFPVDEATGRPMIAFSERGIPVDPEHPTSWGSGAGAIYLTDGTETVYAAVVAPMGDIKLRKYDSASGSWL